MDLKKLSDHELAESLSQLVARERSLLCVIIFHVMEMQRRKSYLKSLPNLFLYLKDLLKYSHGGAQRRKDAAFLALEIPELLHDVNYGGANGISAG